MVTLYLDFQELRIQKPVAWNMFIYKKKCFSPFRDLQKVAWKTEKCLCAL